MPEWVMQAMGMALSGVAAGLGAYVALKSEVAALHVSTAMAAKTAERAHQRIDDILKARV